MNPDEFRRRYRQRGEARRDPSLDQKRQHQLMEFLQKKSNQHQGKRARTGTGSQPDDQAELTLPDDLFFKIFLLVPAESLSKAQFVSKKWFDLINSSMFIEFQAKETYTVLISRELFVPERSDEPVLPPEAHPLIGALVTPPSVVKKPSRFFHFVDFDGGSDNFVESTAIDLVNVIASCNGLILGKTKETDSLMVVINPFTRKHVKIPSGTIGFHECYTLVFCDETRTYKIVHLFREEIGRHRYTCCEIFDINTKKWTVMDGPPPNLLEDITQTPVSVRGSLLWMPKRNGGTKYLSMNVMGEKFVSKDLPVTSVESDRLLEFGGVLGFVTHVTVNLMNVWILKNNEGSDEKWIKRHSIYQGPDVTRFLPICSSRNGKEMVFEYVGGDLYVYKFEEGVMKKICSRDDELNDRPRRGAEKLFIPHRNTLVWLD